MNTKRKDNAGSPSRPRRDARAKAGLALLFALSLGALALVPPGAAAPPPPPAAQAPRQRKDIRAVEASPDELKNLRHAFFMMKKRPATCGDPNAQNEYDCWAAYHNNFDLFGCRHGTDLFWPWHRNHLVEFEKALRSSDPANPERVRDVTLPYWNWTQAPSGRFFPKSVEQQFLDPGEYYPEDCPDPNSPCPNPLWIDGRRTGSCQAVRPECVQEALQLPTWRDFGGGQQGGQFGDFELQAHNFMHASYIGGPMASPETASQDPIYWLFHTYIDNVWDQWQRVHQTDPCSPGNVPGPNRSLTLGDWPASGVQFKDVLCSRNLGYEYAPYGVPLVAALPSCPPPRSQCIANGPVTPVVLRASSAAAPQFEKAELRLSGVTIPEKFSYNAWVLLHPGASPYRPADEQFIDRNAATYFVAWRHAGHAGHAAHARGRAESNAATMEVGLDVTRRLRELARAGGLKGLGVTIVFAPADRAERPSPLVFRRDVNFAAASLVVTSGGKARTIRLSPGR